VSKDREALLRKIGQFAADPSAPAPWAKPLAGVRHAVRIRQGDWRAVCRIDRAAKTVTVEAAGDRKEIYR
jgi:mRNA-degrading endonuclease RelE of RelBE toxin-antitoxin system